MEDQKTPAPIPIQGDVGVHLAYIRRDIDTIKKNQEDGMKDLKSDIKDLKDGYVSHAEFNDLKNDVDKSMIRREEFDPIKKLVYGMVALVLVAFVGGLIVLVFK